ncbi:unnamed protein product [Rangifer tarandus platyrhynchus]|uniref:Uncharacterized protein n=1 Tax=Rangifer tarandus platyrhynchus TaxID=3082113 RepID=A0AC59YJ22_RANTA
MTPKETAVKGRTAFKGSGACSDGSADPGSLGPLLGVGTCRGSCRQGPTPGIRFSGPGGPGSRLWLLRCSSFCSARGALLSLRNRHWWGRYEEAPRRTGGWPWEGD